MTGLTALPPELHSLEVWQVYWIAKSLIFSRAGVAKPSAPLQPLSELSIKMFDRDIFHSSNDAVPVLLKQV